MLEPGRTTRALEAAAQRGAHVVVRLEQKPAHDAAGALARQNERTVKELKSFGADAALVPNVHIKAAICDGAAYLDERNFPATGPDTIVRDDTASDVTALGATIEGQGSSASTSICTTKRSALAAETVLLRDAKNVHCVQIQTETFGASSGVYGALRALAESGVHCELSVATHGLDQKESIALSAMQRAGVQVRVGGSDEKMALVDGKTAWLGSANATSPYDDLSDWGLQTSDGAIVAQLDRHFEANWKNAKPFTAPSQTMSTHLR